MAQLFMRGSYGPSSVIVQLCNILDQLAIGVFLKGLFHGLIPERIVNSCLRVVTTKSQAVHREILHSCREIRFRSLDKQGLVIGHEERLTDFAA